MAMCSAVVCEAGTVKRTQLLTKAISVWSFFSPVLLVDFLCAKRQLFEIHDN
jgi:hypothetical protein